MLTLTEMSTGNNDSFMLPIAQEFHCCCLITRNEFDANGTFGAHIFCSIVLVLISISATLGNLLVLVSIWRTPSLRSPSNVLLFGLAVSDLGVGLLVEPIHFVYRISKRNGLERIFCNSAVSLRLSGALLCFASLFTITAISVDMYIALYLHLRYQEIVTVKRMTGVLVGIWVCSITASLLNIWYLNHLWMLWISLTLLCLLVTMSAYYKVFRIVRYHQGQIHAQAQVREQAEDQDEDPTSIEQHRKSLMNKFVVYCLFVICYLPIVVIAVVVKTTDFSVTIESIYEVSYMAIYFNSTLNPLIYCWRFEKIRAEVIETTRTILQLVKKRPLGNEGSINDINI